MSQTTRYASIMGATRYASTSKSVFSGSDLLHLEFETHLSIQIANFLVAKEPTLGKMSLDLALRESNTLGAKCTSNTSEFFGHVAESLFFLLTNIGPVPG